MKNRWAIVFGAWVAAQVALCPVEAGAQEPFLGEIRIFGMTFCPRGWTEADGQLLPISQNSALFALLGTTYGGDGRTTFALPDLRGRAPIHTGSGPGLTPRPLGSRGGQESVVLDVTEMPGHDHASAVAVSGETATSGMASAGDSLAAASAAVTSGNGNGNGAGNAKAPDVSIYAMDAPSIELHDDSVAEDIVGGNQPHPNMAPFLTMRYCIALNGIFPSRN